MDGQGLVNPSRIRVPGEHRIPPLGRGTLPTPPLTASSALAFSRMLTPPEIDRIVSDYQTRDMARYEQAAAFIGERLRRELRAASFGRYLVSFRAKHPADLTEKLRRKREQYAYADFATGPGAVITDLSGCRVIVYEPNHEAVAADVVRRALPVSARPDADEGPRRERTGYRATHILVAVPDEAETLAIRGAICEVQISSLASHLFNELEHDIRYKDHGVPVSTGVDELLGVLTTGSRTVDELAGLVLAERARNVVHVTQRLDTSEHLRHALEREVGRAMKGDFARLHRMLNQLLAPLTINALKEAVGPLQEALIRGEAMDAQPPRAERDDVTNFALGLLTTFRDEFSAMARSWRGPTTALKEAILSARPAEVANG